MCAEKLEKDNKISTELLKILACPKCKGELKYDEKRNLLICCRCELAYRIEDGIPIMLIDEAIHFSC